MIVAINLIALALAAIILWQAESSLAAMGTNTRPTIRYAMLILAGGALWVILTIADGQSIDQQTIAILAGIALLITRDRRDRRSTEPKGGRHA